MHIRILGSAAGGGVPQWNCRCPNCEAVRAGSPRVRPRTQSSLAVSADERSWFLLNVSPDIRQQILAFPPLGPPAGKERGQGIKGCVLTDAELDHTAGLLLLREGEPFFILGTPLVRHWLNRYLPLEPMLAEFARPTWRDLRLGEPIVLPGPGLPEGSLRLQAFEVERHVPRFVTEDARKDTSGSVIGLVVEDLKTRGKLLYAPCVGSLSEPLLSLAKDADAIFLDGTFWSDDEPLRFSKRTALQMGHIPVSGPQGSLTWLGGIPTGRARHRVYLHINNTNPMLNEDGPEFRLVNESGVRVGADGDTFDL
jgi:pyrroloquinoline quinone biosynthesis protein B